MIKLENVALLKWEGGEVESNAGGGLPCQGRTYFLV